MSTKGDKEIVNRLCSEIQLFDLCELDNCGFKRERFCTDKELLTRFESIKEEDDRPPVIYEEDEALDDDPGLMNDYDEFEMEQSDDE